jgi:Uma2 family endonuclease
MQLAVHREELMNISVEDEIGVGPRRRRFTVEEFQRMAEAGVFGHDERLELIDGEVIQMSPVGPRHIWSIVHLTKLLVRLAGDEFYVSVQSGVTVGIHQLAPDFAVLRLLDGKEPGSVPVPEDCLLLIEVSDSSATFDRVTKRAMYAEAGIPEYWVLDLPGECVVVHRTPKRGVFQVVTEHPRGRAFTSPAFPAHEFDVDDLLKFA